MLDKPLKKGRRSANNSQGRSMRNCLRCRKRTRNIWHFNGHGFCYLCYMYKMRKEWKKNLKDLK